VSNAGRADSLGVTGTTSKYQIRDAENGKSNHGTGGDCEQEPIEPRASSRNFQEIFSEVLLKNRMRRMMCGLRHMQDDTSSLLMRRGMCHNSTYQIAVSRERLRCFFTFGIILMSPELRRGRLEFHSELVKSGGLFASRPNDSTANAKPSFLTVDRKNGALRPINGRQNQGSVKVYYGCHHLK
jgi:hypothetical protein